MKRWTLLGCLLFLIGAASFAVAENPFVGNWKLDPAKSHLAGSTMKFSSTGNGMIRETVAEGSYTFKTDGQSYPALFGDTENWTKLSGHSWKTTVQMHGGFTATYTWDISNDGQTLTTTSSGTNPDGSAFHNTVVYKRMAGGKDLMGTWKSTAVKADTDRTMEFAANGDDGITWNLPQIKATVHMKFDGKDTVPEGPTVPTGLTLAATKDGPRSFLLVEKMNGKPIYKAKYMVSADGNTLTQVGAPVGQAQMETSVYNKQ